jgi:putative ABC transport system permease protein
VYLHSSRGGFVSGNMNNVYIFSVIAALILFIACINFINLSTTRSAERAKEIGIRKLTGAARSQLIGQFMIETILICLMAFLLSLLLSSLLLPEFNQLAGKTVSLTVFHPIKYVLYLLMLAVFVGIVTGIYPAFILSSRQPALVLKGAFLKAGKGCFSEKHW